MKKYFIPHEGNDYKPHILRPRTIAFVCLIALVAEAGLFLGATYFVPHSKLFGIITVNALVDETNQSRMQNHLQPLTENPLLDAAAQAKANDMVANNYFAHTSPSGVTPWAWFQQSGYQYIFAAENLAVDFSDSQDVTNAWMNSPEHRENILNGNYVNIGMATAQGTYQGHPAVYVVELFGTPAGPGFPFVSTAAAASPASAPAATSTPATSTPAQKPSPSPVPKPVTPSPKPKPAPVVATSVTTTTVVATTSLVVMTSTSASATSVATSGLPLQTQTQPPAPTQTVERQSNFIQLAFSDPKAVANYFYLALMILFAIAIGLNIFIKFNIQHPKLIFGGLLVIVLAGLCVMLNQSALFHATIL